MKSDPLQGYFRTHLNRADVDALISVGDQLEAAANRLGELGDHQRDATTEELTPTGSGLADFMLRIDRIRDDLAAFLATAPTEVAKR